jgi:hypothetical protein
MTHPLARAVLCLWLATLCVALLVMLRSCGQEPLLTVRLEMSPIPFTEK